MEKTDTWDMASLFTFVRSFILEHRDFECSKGIDVVATKFGVACKARYGKDFDHKEALYGLVRAKLVATKPSRAFGRQPSIRIYLWEDALEKHQKESFAWAQMSEEERERVKEERLREKKTRVRGISSSISSSPPRILPGVSVAKQNSLTELEFLIKAIKVKSDGRSSGINPLRTLVAAAFVTYFGCTMDYFEETLDGLVRAGRLVRKNTVDGYMIYNPNDVVPDTNQVMSVVKEIVG